MKLKDYIEKQHLLSPGATVIVGFSGGADSVALLHILHQCGYQCVAAHCNFHLRGEESMRDEAFAHAFAESNKIPFEKTDFDTRQYASEQKISIEMAARDLRYAWFETLRLNYQAEAIAVAHQKEDSIETVLLNLIRGTGIRGLTGIRAQSGHVIRPLLAANKKEILDYIQENKLEFVTDSSNLTVEYTRNLIRLQVLPLLQTINPSVTDAIERTATHLSMTEKIYEEAIDRAKSSVLSADDRGEKRIDIHKMLTFVAPEALLYEILSGYDFNHSVIRDVADSLTGQSGKLFYSSSHRLVKDRDFLILTPIANVSDACARYTISEDDAWMTHPVPLTIETVACSPDFTWKEDRSVAYFDRDKIQFPLYLRKWREGDVFVPFGMKGKQKIAKYFKDHLFSRTQKEACWLLCSGNNIIWIVNERSDNRYRVETKTQHILVIKTR